MTRRAHLSIAGQAAFLASALVLGVVARGAVVTAQAPTSFSGPACAIPPPLPGQDTWPVAVTDSLHDTTSPMPVPFTGASLLSNDHATSAVTLINVASTSEHGGTIAGADPFVYTPAPLFTGTDIFTYRIRDAASETTTGVVKVVVNPNAATPAVSIVSPTGGTVSGIVTIAAATPENVQVAAVTFFDGTTPVGAEAQTAPFGAAWDSRLVADGPHSLTAVARDAAGNTASSAAVVVNVLNAPPR